MKGWGWIVLAGAVALAGCKTPLGKAEAQSKTAETKAKAAGVALTPGDALASDPPVLAAENAALPMKDVLRKMLKKRHEGQYAAYTQGLNPEYSGPDGVMTEAFQNAFVPGKKVDYAAVEKAVRKVDPILDEVEKAVRRPKWFYSRDWDQGAALLLPEYARFKTLARWMYTRALVAVHDGRDDEAIRTIDALLRLSNHLRAEPLIIAVLIGFSAEKVAESAMVNAARLQPGNKPLLRRLKALAAAPRAKIDWRRIWRFENAMQLLSLEGVTTEEGLKGIGYKPGEGQLRSRTQMFETRAKILDLLTQAEARWQGPSDDLATFAAVTGEFEKKIQDVYFAYHEVFQMLSSDLPLHTVSDYALPQTETHRRLTWLALTMVERGPVQGLWRLPAEASQREWLDPFSGKPFLLRNVAKGFVLYGVGRNRKDDLGNSQENDGTPLDILLDYPLRQKALRL